jgi:probable phosphoglycerate mutase
VTEAPDSRTPEEGYRQHRYEAPPGATTILLVRHGESQPEHPDRPFPMVDGHGDPPLDPVGRRQAELLADRLEHEDLAAIYVTTLQRTHETAAPTATRLGLTPIVEADLREVFLGDWEGNFRAKAAAGDPAFIKVFSEERWDVIPGAESLDALDLRTWEALMRIAAAHVDQRVMAVSHGGVIGHLLHRVTDSRRFAFSGPDNASISEVVVMPEQRVVLRRYNDVAHLLPLTTTS